MKGRFESAEAGPDHASGTGDVARELDRLETYRNVVLAVSGGPDSVALLHLVARWRDGRCGAAQATRIEVATVDHRLRPEAADEARWVADLAHSLGFAHTILVPDGDPPTRGLQEAAREMRYRLLARHAGRERPAAIVTAHTEDDQAETVLMRLARGSGLDGLSAMSPVRPSWTEPGVDIVRPLLGVPKRRLLAILTELGASWLNDPSNERLDFERVRLREARDVLSDLGLTSRAIALSARRLQRVREALEQVVLDFARREVSLHDGIFASVERSAFFEAAEEVRVRVLARLLEAFGGTSPEARLSQVEELVLHLAESSRVAVTLGGCIVSAGERHIRIYREPRRASIPSLELRPGTKAVWDGRFEVSLAGRAEDRIFVRPLGMAAYATLSSRSKVRSQVPARAAAGLPSFWSDDRLVAVPQLGIGDGEAGLSQPQHEACEARFIGWRAHSA